MLTQFLTITTTHKLSSQPCSQVGLHAQLTHTENDGNTRQLRLAFYPEVKVIQHEIAYGMFELVVDVGSSLGLWIGLTFIGIFDGLVDISRFIVEKTLRRGERLQGVKSQHQV